MKKNKYFKLIKNNNILSSIAVLASGTGLSQIFPIITAPILTRLYSPEEFGIYALFYSIFTILSGLVMLEYNNVIILSSTKYQSKQGILLCSIISLGFCLLFFLAIFIIYNHTNYYLLNEKLSPYLIIIPFTVFVNSLNSQLYYWFLRTDELKFVSTNKVVMAFIAASIQIIMGLLKVGVWGLVLANLFSIVIANLLYFYRFFKNEKTILDCFNLREIIDLSIVYKNFPKVGVWSNILNICTLQIPELFISKYLGVNFLGHYSLANRTISLPMSFIGSSIQEIFKKNASKELRETKTIYYTYKTVLNTSLIIGCFFLFLFVFFVPPIFTYIFGSDWSDSGLIIRTMSLLFVIRFIVAPLSYSLFIFQKQKMDLYWQIGLLLVTSMSLFGSQYLGITNPFLILFIFVVFVSIWYIINLSITYKLAKKTIIT